ncbi:MAG TPA: hypothetical protein PKD12_08125 [Nitrospira sp.]|nr:hypothetical protein [Nitrospira sp.]
MDQSKFQEVLDEQLSRISSILGIKTREYATQEDQLKNIREAAKLQNIALTEAVGGMMAKHTVSIYAMIRDTERDFPMTMWNEKITDHIIWLILLLAVLEDDYTEKDNASA